MGKDTKDTKFPMQQPPERRIQLFQVLAQSTN